MRRSARSLLAAATAVLTAGGLVAAVPAAQVLAAPAAQASRPLAIAPGVSLSHLSITFEGHKQSIWTLNVDINPRIKLVSTTPGRVIGAKRIDLLALAKQEKAIAGLNGDTLYYVDPTAQPHSGVAYNGRTLKSPVKDQQSVFYTTTAGKAYIGNVGFTGSFSTGPRRLKTIATYNSLENAKNGGITFTDSSLLTRPSMKGIGNASMQRITPRCTSVGLSPTRTKGAYTVTSYRTNLTSYSRVASGTKSFYTCGGDSKSYLADTIRVGNTVSVDVHYAAKNIVSMVSGVRKLIAGGKAYNDKGGLNDLGPSMLPESFICIAPGGTHLLLGAVDGRTRGAAGMTYAMLTRYLLSRHCGSAVAMDGSTDSQLVAQRPGGRLAFQNHLTYKVGNKPNGLVSALVIVRQ